MPICGYQDYHRCAAQGENALSARRVEQVRSINAEKALTARCAAQVHRNVEVEVNVV